MVGYPKNMDDTIGERAKACEELQKALERRTDYLLHCGMKDLLQLKQTKSLKNADEARNRKTVIDQLAAVLFCVDIWNLNRVIFEDLFFMEKLEFIDENGEKTQFYVIEETKLTELITCLPIRVR
ncbi:MAG: hypothetical protein ACLS9K_03055 [Lachnospira eligens]